MKILVTGACGFVGSTIIRSLLESHADVEVSGIDSLIRPGAEVNRAALRGLGVKVRHADLRVASDIEALPAADWVVDAAANPSVLAGVDGRTSSRQLVEHNLSGTVNLLEYCRARRSGFLLLSTSRVYSIPPLASLPVVVKADAFVPDTAGPLPAGLTPAGVDEGFSTKPPVSLYGATKLASEALALEYGAAFGFPVWINRCGVLAGAGQFGRADQGIFSYWIHSWKQGRPLACIGFGGMGHQVRDCLHPRDLVPLMWRQMLAPADHPAPRVLNVSGGAASAMSLRQLSAWCGNRFGPGTVRQQAEGRPFDIPWMVLDATAAEAHWGWRPATGREAVLEEIARHAEQNPHWLDISAPLE